MPASGATFPLGQRTVQVSAQDGAGNTAAGSFTVTVRDTIKPEASVPPALIVSAGPTGTALLGDLTGRVTRSDLVGVTSVVQSPGPETVLPLGSHPVSFAVSDAAGNVTTVQTTVTISFDRPDPADTATNIAATGQLAPGAGTPDGPPEGTVLSAFGAPAISDFRDMASLVTMTSGRTKLAGIYVQDGAGNDSLRASQGAFASDAIGITGWTFRSFRDPVIAPGGAIAFVATVAAPGNGTHQGVFTDLFTAPGRADYLMLQGGEVPGLNGELLKSVTSLSLRNDGLLALLTLASGSSAASKVTAKDDTALVLFTGAKSATVLLREGAPLRGLAFSKIKAFTVLSPALGSAGQGRWHGDGAVVAKVTLDDGRTLVVKIDTEGAVKRLLATGDPARPVAVQAQWKSIGLPAMGGDGAQFAVAATLKAAPGIVTTKDDSVLLFSPDGATWSAFAREHEPAPMAPDAEGALYGSFFDPVANDAGQVAFLAMLQGPGIKAANGTGLFCGTTDHLRLIARLGSVVPDESAAATTAAWSRFISYALPGGDGAGVIFLAETGGGDATTKNTLALWAVDSTGTLRRLIRTGAPLTLDGPALTGLTLLNAPPAAFGAARSYNSSGSVAVLATFADKSQALLRLDIP
jgi:hypothetical protein